MNVGIFFTVVDVVDVVVVVGFLGIGGLSWEGVGVGWVVEESVVLELELGLTFWDFGMCDGRAGTAKSSEGRRAVDEEAWLVASV